jgi:hypothetical protein
MTKKMAKRITRTMMVADDALQSSMDPIAPDVRKRLKRHVDELVTLMNLHDPTR